MKNVLIHSTDINELNKIQLSAEVLDKLNAKSGDMVGIYLSNGALVIKKLEEIYTINPLILSSYANFSAMFADSPVMICSNETIVAASNNIPSWQNLVGTETQDVFRCHIPKMKETVWLGNTEYKICHVEPIIYKHKTVGTIVVIDPDLEDWELTGPALKSIEDAATYISKTLEL